MFLDYSTLPVFETVELIIHTPSNQNDDGVGGTLSELCVELE